MNLFADRLFALLLGWTRSLFNGLWNLFTNNVDGLAGFLRRFWLPFILVLLIFGTLADYIVWLIRWRPYYAWSAWLRNWAGNRRLAQTRNFMEDLDHSPLDLPEYQGMEEGGGPGLVDEPVYFDFQPAWQEQPDPGFQPVQGDMPLPEAGYPPQGAQADPPPLFVPSLPWEIVRQVPVLPTDGPGAPPWLTEGRQNGAIQQPLEPFAFNADTPDLAAPAPDAAQAASGRRRRVDTKRQRGPHVIRSIRETFFQSEADSGAIDSIQPPVAPEEAFHKPYYPQNYTYKELPPPDRQDRPPQ